jgi:hypothetical protein
MTILYAYIDVISSQFEKLHHLEIGYIDQADDLTAANFLDNVVWLRHRDRSFDLSWQIPTFLDFLNTGIGGF